MFEQIVRFSFPTRIVFGRNAIAELPALLKEAEIARPLLVTDPGLRATPVFETVKRILEAAGVPFAVYSETRPNPVEADIEAAGAVYKTQGCDGAIGLGGGSALDAAKAVAVRVSHPGPLADYEAQAGGWLKIKAPVPRVIAIPTTAGTGSEVGRSAVITIPSLGRKIVIFSPLLMPFFALEDPELTVGLPPHLTAATGMDALTHCIESLTAPVFHPLADGIALHGIELVGRYLERATRDGSDIEARGYMLIAASMGAISFQKDLGAAHSLAHPLSTEFGTHHGLANSICLPAVMKFNLEVSAPEYARVARQLGEAIDALSQPEAARRGVEAVEALIDRLGLPKRLRDINIPREALPALSQKAFEDSCHQTNPRPCSREDLLKLYEESW